MPARNIIIHESRKTKLKWKEPKKWKDEYRYPIVQLQADGENLCFKFTPTRYKGQTVKPLYMTIESYRQYTALEVINALDDVGFNTRHSYDAVLKFYHERHLDLGFTRKILKPLKTKTI